MKRIILFTIGLIFLSGCADNMHLEQAISADKVGFWYGLWHGMA